MVPNLSDIGTPPGIWRSASPWRPSSTTTVTSRHTTVSSRAFAPGTAANQASGLWLVIRPVEGDEIRRGATDGMRDPSRFLAPDLDRPGEWPPGKRAAGHYVVDGIEPIVTLHETRIFVICRGSSSI